MTYSSSINLGLANLPELNDKAISADLSKSYAALKSMASSIDVQLERVAAIREYFKTIDVTVPADEIPTAGTKNMILGNFARIYVQAVGNITAGYVVGFVRSGDVVAAMHAVGIVPRGIALASVSAGQYLPVQLCGRLSGLSGLRTGECYVLNAATGGIAPWSSGHRSIVGFALNSTSMWINL